MNHITLNSRTIKQIDTLYFELALYELTSGKYLVAYSRHGDVTTSEPIADFNIASYVFSAKLAELEGQ